MFMNRNKYQDIFKRILIIFFNFFSPFIQLKFVSESLDWVIFSSTWQSDTASCVIFLLFCCGRVATLTRTMTQVPSSATGMSCPCWRYKCTYLFMFPWFLHKRVRVIIVFIYISPAGWYTWPGCQADVTSQAKSDALLKRKS